MKTRLIRIGNSQGIRIPKPILEQAGLEDEVTLTVTENGIVIEATGRPREGWSAAALLVRERQEDGLVDETVLTTFDDSEWEWE